MKPLRDAKGAEIRPGDVLRIFHFAGARRKRHYMYKQALEYVQHPKGGWALRISHLNNPLGALRDEIGSTFYVEVADGRALEGYEVVQSNTK